MNPVLLSALIEKLPQFNLGWPDDLKASWLSAFGMLLKLLK
jgi:hypothetical protein